MKKLICILLSAMFVLCLFTSCSEKGGGETTTTATENSTTTEPDKTTTEAQGNETLSQSDNALNSQQTSDVGGGTMMGWEKYRSIYSSVPRPFINLVDVMEYQEWNDTKITEDPNEINVMVMKRFIEDFNISREDFDRANVEWAKIIKNGFNGQPVMNPQDFANQQINEVYNADIIYTFDDETINEYYLNHEYPFIYELEFKQAVENGTYQTQTKDWIDIEKMEAEINAKYGTSNAEVQTTAGESKIDFLRELFSKKK